MIITGKISIIIPAKNEGENLVDTVDVILRNTIYCDFEVIVVDDQSTDGGGERVAERFGGDARVSLMTGPGLGIAPARNCGAARATGELLVFLDGHCYLRKGWLTSLAQPFANADVGMVGPVFKDLRHHGHGQPGVVGVAWHDASLLAKWLPIQHEIPYEVHLLPGGCQAVRRRLFDQFGGYDEEMRQWGSEDVELSLRFWLMGAAVIAQPQTVVYHLFREKSAYPVDYAAVLCNTLRLAMLHFNEERVARVFDHYKSAPDFSRSLVMLMKTDVKARREELLKTRKRDDDWYCERFGFNL